MGPKNTTFRKNQRQGLFLQLPGLFLNKRPHQESQQKKSLFSIERNHTVQLGNKTTIQKSKKQNYEVPIFFIFFFLQSHVRQICLQTVLAKSKLVNKDKVALQLKFTFTLMTFFVFLFQNHIEIMSSILILPIQSRTCLRIAEKRPAR